MSTPQTVIVTGGASGIGFAIAEAVLAEGWRAVVADRDQKNLDHAREALGERDDVRFAVLDIADEEAVVRTVASCEAEFGPLAGLVNSAGIGCVVPVLETSTDTFRKIVEVNLTGSFVMSREAARHMAKRGRGAILNIASVSGIMGNAERAAYGASKGGQITLTRIMAVDLAEAGIRVNAIAPGPIETPMAQEMHSQQTRETWLSTVPQRRYGTSEEIAAAAVFLLDDAKSGYITGQTLCVDGGFTIAGLLRPRSADPVSAAA